MIIAYYITNDINNKIYVGKDSKNNPNYLGSGKILNKAITKYGREHFKKHIIGECFSQDEVNELEKFMISEMNTLYPNGYNLTTGGEGMPGYSHTKESKLKMGRSGEFHHMFGKKHSEKTIQKMSERKFSKETIEKMSQAKKDKPSPLKGLKRSEEFCKKIGLSSLGRKHSENTKKRMSDIKKGKKFSKEHKLKISIYNKNRKGMVGEKNPFYGKKHTDETKKIMSERHKDYKKENHPQYIKIDIEEIKKLRQEGMFLKDIAKQLNTTYSTIQRRYKELKSL